MYDCIPSRVSVSVSIFAFIAPPRNEDSKDDDDDDDEPGSERYAPDADDVTGPCRNDESTRLPARTAQLTTAAMPTNQQAEVYMHTHR
jgi:hypothetical protein